MSKKVYITIDDTPSGGTDKLVDFLTTNNIQATIFCRGDALEQNPDAAIAAVQAGQILANHNYSHTPAGDLDFEDIIAEIMHTESLLDDIYARANKTRMAKYFRFPYIDKGDGDRLERRFGDITKAVETGADIDIKKNNKTARIQNFLKDSGFTQPYKNVTHPLYRHPIAQDDIDSLFTYSSCDWMLTKRHQGQWPYKTLDDLKQKIDDDIYLQKENSVSIALFHDQEEIIDVSIALIKHMIDTGFAFLSI